MTTNTEPAEGPAAQEGATIAVRQRRATHPPRTRYWVDPEGRLLRFEARIGDDATFDAADLDTIRKVTVEILDELQ